MLTSLAGLDNVTYIGGDLQIGRKDNECFGNPSLTSLEGLNNLISIGKNLGVECNDALTSLAGLNNIEAATIDSLCIRDNNSLSTCEVQSICDYLLSPNGTVEIHSNAPGCNSQEEVEEACVQSVDKVSVISNLSIQPNPFSNVITIEFELRTPEIVTITIYNHLGEQITMIEKKQSQGKQEVVWKAEGLPAGIYFCTLKTNNGKQTTKMIKL